VICTVQSLTVQSSNPSSLAVFGFHNFSFSPSIYFHNRRKNVELIVNCTFMTDQLLVQFFKQTRSKTDRELSNSLKNWQRKLYWTRTPPKTTVPVLFHLSYQTLRWWSSRIVNWSLLVWGRQWKAKLSFITRLNSGPI
jgi:hypothetical protein